MTDINKGKCIYSRTPPGPAGKKVGAALFAKPVSTPGPLGKNDAAELLAKPAMMPPLIIHLDLTELIDLNIVGVPKAYVKGTSNKKGSYPTVIKKGPVMEDSNNPNRPKVILGLVRKKFYALRSDVRIELATGGKFDRLLKVVFSIRNSAVKLGRAALATSRMKGMPGKEFKFTPDPEDAGKGVSAYVAEGPINFEIGKHYGEPTFDPNPIFASAVAHELGHNLGLLDIKSLNNIMFVYGGRPETEQKKWFDQAIQDSLTFSEDQINKMRRIVNTP